jgi:hypothetical protein
MVSRTHLIVKFICALPVLSFVHTLQVVPAYYYAGQPFSFHHQFVFRRRVYFQQDIAPQRRAECSQRLFFSGDGWGVGVSTQIS